MAMTIILVLTQIKTQPSFSTLFLKFLFIARFNTRAKNVQKLWLKLVEDRGHFLRWIQFIINDEPLATDFEFFTGTDELIGCFCLHQRNCQFKSEVILKIWPADSPCGWCTLCYKSTRDPFALCFDLAQKNCKQGNDLLRRTIWILIVGLEMSFKVKNKTFKEN